MVKLRTLKNSYSKIKESFTKIRTEDEYVLSILEEAVAELNSGEAVLYTEEEFWDLVEKNEMEEYGESISRNIRKKCIQRFK